MLTNAMKATKKIAFSKVLLFTYIEKKLPDTANL